MPKAGLSRELYNHRLFLSLFQNSQCCEISRIRSVSRVSIASLGRSPSFPSHWPNPLKSHSCNLVTASDVLRPVSVSGWVDSIRVMKDSVFIVLRDGCGRVQTLFPCDKDGCPPKRLSRLVEDVLKDIPLESVVCVTGTVWMGVISESRCKSAPKMPLIPTCRRAVLKSRGITSIS